MPPDFCPRCGKRTKLLVKDPEFCGACGLLLVALDADDDEPVAPAVVVAGDRTVKTYNPYPGLDSGHPWSGAIDRLVARYDASGLPLPLKVGVIIDMGVPVETSLPMHRRNIDSTLADPAQRPLPYNLMVDPFSDKPALWEDVRERHISRAAAIVYYWGGAAHGRAWHIDEPLDPRIADRLVTVDDQTIDFELRFSIDHNLTVDLERALEALEGYLRDGINTKNRRVEAVGQPDGWAIFGMDELDPKYRSKA